MKKLYRVNESEAFNLDSMYSHLKAIEIDAEDGIIPFPDDLDTKIEEVESLYSKAPCVGALVDWPTLKRIREIKEERQRIRYLTCLNAGVSEADAAIAFTL